MVAWDYRRSALKLNGARRESRNEAAGDRNYERNVGVRPNVSHLAGSRPRSDVKDWGLALRRHRVDHTSRMRATPL